MNRELIIQNISKFYKDNKSDFLKTVSNIAYLYEHMCYEKNTEKIFYERVDELKYNPYSGQLFLEKAAEYLMKSRISYEELCWRLEVMIEAENDEYLQVIDWLYYETIRFSLKFEFKGDIVAHICCAFPKEVFNEVADCMQSTISVQKMKRNKRLEINLMKLHYQYDDGRIAYIEKNFYEMPSVCIDEVISKIVIRDLITFMLICSQECKILIYEKLDENKLMEIEKFQGSAFYLKNETVKDCIEKIYNTVK